MHVLTRKRRAHGGVAGSLTRASALLLVIFCGQAKALEPGKAFHNYVRDAWTLDQGLPQIAVATIAQDREGYIWAGTMNGLARFDGTQFRVFTPANTPALPAAQIRALQMDSDGRLWVASQKGLAWEQGGRFTTVPVENPAAAAEIDVQDILISSTGDVLASTSRGLYRVADGRLQQVPSAPGPLFGLLEQGGQRWVGALGGVYRGPGVDLEFEALPGLDLHEPVLTLTASGSGSQHRVWAGTASGLFYRDGEGWHRYATNPVLAGAAIGVLYEDHDRNLWVGTQSGLFRIRDGAVAELVENDRMGTRWDFLSACEDREGNLWFGSRTRGLTRVWNGLTTRYTTAEGLTSPQVWSLSRDPAGQLWVGTDNGLSQLDNGRFRQIVPGTALANPNVYTVLAENDQVWLGTMRGAAVLRHGQLQTIAGLHDLRINGIFRDSRKQLWFATSNGLFLYTDSALTRYGEAEGLSDASVRLIFETGDGRLLLGTQFGLAELRNGTIHVFGPAEGLPRDVDVTALHELPDGRLVVGTATEQLFVSDRGHWIEFNHGNGLPQNTAFYISEDSRGFLWVSGVRGLYRVPSDQLRWRGDDEKPQVEGELFGADLATRPTGVRGECCNGAGNAKGLLERGVLWLPTRDGVLTVPTEALARNAVPPKIRIEGIGNDDADLNADGTLASETLPAGVRDLKIRMAALSFQDPYSVLLQYRLRGHDREWQTPADPMRRVAEYRQLPPGDYVFEVRAANNSGVWAEQPATLRFGVAAYFYESIWFYAFCALVIAGLAGAGLRWQRGAHSRRRAALENLVAQRTDALAAVNQQLEQASNTDPLTGLRNRRYLLNQLPQDLAFYRRKSEHHGRDQVLLFAMIDVDHFKRVNDGHGHACGDRVLQQFSRRLTELVRVGDYVTRWGGEEFLVVSRPLSRDNAAAYIERICRMAADEPFEVGAPHALRLSCSIGFAEYPLYQTPNGLDWHDLVELADRALYYVKNHGRNGWACFRIVESSAYAFLGPRLRATANDLLSDGAIELISQIGPTVRRLESAEQRARA